MKESLSIHTHFIVNYKIIQAFFFVFFKLFLFISILHWFVIYLFLFYFYKINMI